MQHFAKLSLRSVLLCVFSFLLFQNAFSQVLTSNTFTGASACPTNGNTFSTVTNATVTPLSRNTIACATAANVFNNSTLNNTASRNDISYIEFSITANYGFILNLSSLSFFRQASATAPNSLIVSYSTDAVNFNTTRVDMATSITPTTGTVLTWTFPSTISTSNAGKVTFRFYPFGTLRADGAVTSVASATGAFRLDDVTLNGTVTNAPPSLTASPTSLSNLNYVTGTGPSTAQSYTLSGFSFTPTADTIRVKSTSNYEISSTFATVAGFADSLKIRYTGEALSGATIQVRLKAGLPIGAYNSDSITHKGGNIVMTPVVKLSGSVTAVPPPSITTTGSLSTFYTSIGTPSSSQSYVVSGNNLLADIKIKAPTGFQIKTGAGSYLDSLLLPQVSGSVANTTIDVRLKGTVAGTFTGNIIHTSTTATANVAVNGNVIATIAAVRLPIPEQNTYTGTSVTVAGRVSARFGNSKFYLQDATGGVAIFSSIGSGIAQTYGIVPGDSVILTGVIKRFNGEIEVVDPTFVNRTAGSGASTTPTLFVFDSNNPPTGVNLATFLDVNEGRRIKIISANLITTGSFTASTNYPISACNGQGDSEIRIDVAASQTLTGTTIPIVTQDITGVIGHYITPTATVNILQIFPSSSADFSNSSIVCPVVIPTSAASCGALSATNYSVDSTLDVTCWNVEWLGNTTATPSPLGPTNDAQQMTNVMAVLKATKADIFCIEEVCDNKKFVDSVATNLPGYGVVCQRKYYSHFFDTPETTNSTTFSQKVCFVYKQSVVSYVDTVSLLAKEYKYDVNPVQTPYPNNWASGRLPYMFIANVTLGGITKKIHFVGLHAKSGSAIADYNRRNQDVKDLKAKLDSNAVYANANLIILGDYNDDLDTSIAASKPSSYKNFVTDNVRYNQISKALSDCKVSSTAKYPDIIDHFMTSNEIGVIPTGTQAVTPSSSDIYYLEKTINVSRPINYVANYTTTTSDHYPVNARFKFGIPATIKSVASGNWSMPATWDCNCIPQSINNVIVDTPHTVTVDVASLAKNVDVKGVLNYVSALMLSLGL